MRRRPFCAGRIEDDVLQEHHWNWIFALSRALMSDTLGYHRLQEHYRCRSCSYLHADVVTRVNGLQVRQRIRRGTREYCEAWGVAKIEPCWNKSHRGRKAQKRRDAPTLAMVRCL